VSAIHPYPLGGVFAQYDLNLQTVDSCQLSLQLLLF